MCSADDGSSGRLVHWLVGVAYVGLFTIGIPWYWPEGSTKLWFGLPAWVVTAIAASAAISLLTAMVLCRAWPGEDGPEEGASQGEGDS